MDARQNDQLILSKLDAMHLDITDLKIDMAVVKDQVKKLECTDANTRLTKLETHKNTVSWLGGVLLTLVASKEYIIKIIFG